MQRNFASAFTLIELLIVITIIIILASISYPVYTNVQERARATQDLNNLRQIGIATQMYLNDNDNTLFLPTDNWMKALLPKYIPSWKVFQSPFDQGPTRTPSEDETKAPVSYGFTANALPPAGGSSAISSDRIANPSEFILFAPSQPFSKHGSDAGVTVSKDSVGPKGAKAGGTHSGGKRINACLADLHVENMSWSTFHSDSADPGSKCPDGSTPSVSARWHPDQCNP